MSGLVTRLRTVFFGPSVSADGRSIPVDDLRPSEVARVEAAAECVAGTAEDAVADRLFRHITQIDRDEDGTGTHTYHRDRGESALKFGSRVGNRTVFHEIGHALGAAYGYYRHEGADRPANDYSGDSLSWAMRPRQYMLRAPTEAGGFRVPAYSVTTSLGLVPDVPLPEQDWQSGTGADVGDYVRFGDGFGRVVSRSEDAFEVCTAEGGHRHIGVKDVRGWLPGLCDPRPASTDAERVDRLVAEANKAWYRMYAEYTAGFAPDVPVSGYGMANAHETLAQTHELLFTTDGDHRRVSFSAAFPGLHAAFNAIFDAGDGPVTTISA